MGGNDIRLFVYSGRIGVHHKADSVSSHDWTSFVPTRENEIEIWASTGVEPVERTVSVAPSSFLLKDEEGPNVVSVVNSFVTLEPVPGRHERCLVLHSTVTMEHGKLEEVSYQIAITIEADPLRRIELPNTETAPV